MKFESKFCSEKFVGLAAALGPGGVSSLNCSKASVMSKNNLIRIREQLKIKEISIEEASVNCTKHVLNLPTIIKLLLLRVFVDLLNVSGKETSVKCQILNRGRNLLTQLENVVIHKECFN